MAGARGDVEAEARRIARTFAAKAKAELADADRLLGGAIRVKGSGDPLARVLLVKGRPGPDDVAARRALAGADGEAAGKALAALGLDPASVWATCSRPVAGDAATIARRLESIIEAIDPAAVLALDREAADDLAAATGVGPFASGVPLEAKGRMLGAVDGLEASLADVRAKSRVWRQIQSVFAAAARDGRGPENGKREGRPSGAPSSRPSTGGS